MMMGMDKKPFYSFSSIYHHGEITPAKQDVKFSLVGNVTSSGILNALFLKTWKDFTIKLQTQFLKSPK